MTVRISNLEKTLINQYKREFNNIEKKIHVCIDLYNKTMLNCSKIGISGYEYFVNYVNNGSVDDMFNTQKEVKWVEQFLLTHNCEFFTEYRNAHRRYGNRLWKNFDECEDVIGYYVNGRGVKFINRLIDFLDVLRVNSDLMRKMRMKGRRVTSRKRR